MHPAHTVRLGNAIIRARSVFKYGTAKGLIERVVRYGTRFKKPDMLVLRRHRTRQGTKLFTAEEIRKILDASNPTMRAMVLPGINCRFGASDYAGLPLAALDLEKGTMDLPRPKTGIPRRAALWPEATAALAGSATTLRSAPARCCPSSTACAPARTAGAASAPGRSTSTCRRSSSSAGGWSRTATPSTPRSPTRP
jgi:hypothetical protein